MIEPNRIIENTKPDVFQDLGNGNWYYNYDIQPVDIDRYSYILIKLNGKPDYKRCVLAIIREYITLSQEFDLINSANLVLLDMSEDTIAIDKYKEYLHKINEIKTNIKKDFNIN